MERDLILPETHEKFPGAVWYDKKNSVKKRFRAMYPLICEDPVTKKRRLTGQFETIEEAFGFIKDCSEEENHSRVKNVIYPKYDHKGNILHYECELTNGTRFLFDEQDLSLVQDYTWRPHTTGHIMTNKVDQLPSSLLHLCIMGKPEHGYEVHHLNGLRHDCRRFNMAIVPYHRRGQNGTIVREKSSQKITKKND